MANSVRILITAKDEISSQLDKIRDKALLLSKTDIGKGMAMGAGVAAFNAVKAGADAALSAVVDFGVGSINAASDLNETMSKAEVIFGDNSAAVEDWASTAADAFGQSKRQALDTASGFAGLFKTVGIGIDQSADYAKGLTQLGSDLASFFNTDVDTALNALKSGLAGESEPLRQFNVFLSETAVTSKLAEMGIKKVGGQFTEAQKATARYQLIMEQTGDAQGDFARTSDGLANSQRTLSAEIEDLQASIGEELLPVVRDLSKWAKEDGVPALEDLIQLVKDNKDVFEILGIALHRTVDATGATEDSLVDLAHAFIDAAPPIEGLTGNLGRNRRAAEDAAGAHSEYAIKTRIARNASDRLDDKVSDLVGDFKDLNKWAAEAGDTLAEAAYGPEELRLKFEGTRGELRNNELELERVRKKIKKLHEDGKPVPTDLKEKFNDLEQAVNDGKQEVIRLGTKLRVTGAISMADLQKQFGYLGIKIDGVTGDAQTLWYYLNLISNTDLGTAYDNQAKAGNNRAAGGPVAPYSATTWQENGPVETLYSGSGGGRVMPSGGSNGSGGGMTAVINITAPVLTPGAAQAVADAIGPALTKWQQQRGLVGR